MTGERGNVMKRMQQFGNVSTYFYPHLLIMGLIQNFTRFFKTLINVNARITKQL